MGLYLRGFFALCLISLSALDAAAQSTQDTNATVLDRVWAVGRANACTHVLRDRFSDEQLARLKGQVTSEHDRRELSDVLNGFLFSLGVTHTEFFSPADEGFYFFRTHMALTNPNAPAPPLFLNPGIQIGRDAQGYFVREVLDGFPAALSGVLRGDRLISVDGNPFTGVWGDTEHIARIGITRNGQPLELNAQVLALNWSQALLEASRRSIRTFPGPHGNIGYVRLWTGTHPDSARELQNAVDALKPHVQAMIFDIRGGYGGAWYQHMESFFKNTGSYFSSQIMDVDGNVTTDSPDFHENPDAFTGPMVVLINEGVRSGKEAVAYQFKKTGRAHLIGTPTPGYFSVGGFFFGEVPVDYFLYLCVDRITLDNVQIEGVGIAPDENIEFSPTGPYKDTQLQRAIEYLETERKRTRGHQ